MRTQDLAPDKFRIYRKKAQEFARAMDRAVETGAWNAAGLNAVHAVISAIDAVTTCHLGKRSKSEEHADAAELLRDVPQAGAARHADQARAVLARKSIIEYDARDVTAAEAEVLARRAHRILAWAWSVLPP